MDSETHAILPLIKDMAKQVMALSLGDIAQREVQIMWYKRWKTIFMGRVLVILVLACGCTVNHARYYGRLLEDLNCPCQLECLPLIDCGPDRLCLPYFTLIPS